ncbi:MAG: rod shape-determining protein MreD [Firmicutes bacterium]|nr:rod shape-determining protein MreD [Bacillota bacterium]MCL5039421.1 rod shape-determining protein MreD [Bacillota bacterium]
MRIWRAVLILFFTLLVRDSFLTALVPGWRPELLLLITLLYGIRWGQKKGALLGAIAGGIEDLFLGRYLGLHLFGYLLAGVAAGWTGRRFFRENPLILIGLVFALTLVHQAFMYLLLSSFGFPASPVKLLTRVAWPLAFSNAVFAPFLYQPVAAIPLERKVSINI